MIRANNDGGIVDVDEIADAFQELDEWIMKSGYLPIAWADRVRSRSLALPFDDP
jgi:hypothetical protein